MKICTDVEQSLKLSEILPIESADMYWWSTSLRYYIEAMDDGDFNEEEGHIRAWSLSSLLELMPDKIVVNNENYFLNFNKKSIEYRGQVTWDGQKCISKKAGNLLDAAVEMIVKLYEIELL